MGYGNVVMLRSGLLKRQLPTGTRKDGSTPLYSDIAIETALFIRQVFRLPLRQTEGLIKSLADIMKADIIIPDFSSISKRCVSLSRHLPAKVVEPGRLFIVDSTGFKVYGKDVWHQEKHNVSALCT
jgi:hypothetical protein